VLLTRLPLCIATAFDLHVLGLPPAFVLSQDQTLKLKSSILERLGGNLQGYCVTGTFTLTHT
jgi:hypothetical protein